MSASPLSRVIRTALFCSLVVLSLATIAYATEVTAPGSSTPSDKIAVIVGIIAGIIAIISGIAGFIFWLKRIIRRWINEAVEKADARYQRTLAVLKRDIEHLLLEMYWELPSAGLAEAEAAKRAVLAFMENSPTL